jgi:hypothetical protein
MRRHLRHVVPALAALALLAVIHTWPLARHLTTHLPGEGIGDNAIFAWNTWWMRQALSGPAAFFDAGVLFAPVGTSLVLHTHTASGAFAGSLLPVDAVAATNVLVITCVALNGIAAYAVAYFLTGSRPAAALAGVLFLGAAPLTVRLMGHFNLLYAWTMVAAAVACVRVGRVRSPASGVVAGLAAALVAWTDYYFFIYTVVSVMVVAAADVLRVEHARRAAGRTARVLAVLTILLAIAGVAAHLLGRTAENLFTAAWIFGLAWLAATWRFRLRVVAAPSVPLLPVAAGVVVFALAVAPIVTGAFALWRAGDYVDPPRYWRSAPPGADLATLVMGPPWHGLAGGLVRRAYASLDIDAMEMSGWLGVVPLVLAVLALRDPRLRSQRRVWTALALVFAVWSAGAFLSAGGLNTGVLLPQQALRYVPVVSNARMPARALVVVSFALAMLAALWARSQRPVVVYSLAALAALEQLAAPLPLAAVPHRAIDRALALRPSGIVIELPFGYRDGFGMRGRFDEAALLGQIVHGHPIAGGFVARLAPSVREWYESKPEFRALLEAAERGGMQAVDCAAIARIFEASGARYVVVHESGGERLYARGEPCVPPLR